ncbi:MAG: hypothetical protein AAGC46_01860 [Solirubrobacteraceae bacterium]|nr:hypothetical protein [Patulibacter sp.]
MHRHPLQMRRRGDRDHVTRRGAVLAASAVVAAVFAPAAHADAVWTPVASGTTETITAIDHRATSTVFGTSGGKIFRLSGSPLTSAPVASFGGASIIDIALNPSGTRGVAVLSGGRVSRSADGGQTWSLPIQLKTHSPSENTCPFTPSGTPSNLASEATSVGWASDAVGYVTDGLKGSLEKTADGGSSWTEISRTPSGTCLYGATAVQVAPIVGSDSVYVLDDGNNIGATTNAFGATSTRGYFVGEPSFAVDSADPSRLIGGHLSVSDDSGVTFHGVQVSPADTVISPTRDTSFVGGTAIWVGDNGDVFTSVDGTNAYRQPATGADATRAWRAVSAASASDAMVGGVGGALVLSSTASSIPTVVVPAPTPTPIPISAPAPSPTPSPAPGAGTGGAGAGVTPAGKSVVTLPGATVTLQGPTTCVKAGSAFTATMSMRRIAIKNNRIVKLTRVDFSVDGKRAKIDRKAPFKQRLTVPASAAGTLHTLKAVGYIKVTKGKAPRKTQTVKFRSCA